MPRINRSGVATRARIMEAAVDVLAREGFARFTLQEVATATGIRYGNLTHHYPTRDLLVEAMFETLADAYRVRLAELAQQAGSGDATLREIVSWLLDDAVTDQTASVFLQLWAMSAHMPMVAKGMERLYDQAVEGFLEAYRIAPGTPEAVELRRALYLLGTVIEGTSAIFWTRDRSGQAFRETARSLAVDTLVSVIEPRLTAARLASRPTLENP